MNLLNDTEAATRAGAEVAADVAQALADTCRRNGLSPLRLRGLELLPVKPRCTLDFDCLAQCGLRDGLPGCRQFCIDTQLAAALRGDVKKGLFFRGSGALPFGSQIRSVRELLQRLLAPHAPC